MTAMDLPSAPERRLLSDGRRRRSERTKQLIMEAYLALLRECQDIPTAAQIAARAGISTRLIFERFVDLQSLSLATADYAFAMAKSQAIVHDAEGERPARIRSHVETRAETCEGWLPLWRVLVANQARLPQLRTRLGIFRQAVMQRIELMYAPELGTLPALDRRDLLIALEALIDFESWARMREGHGLSREDACQVWIRMIDRLLPPTPQEARP